MKTFKICLIFSILLKIGNRKFVKIWLQFEEKHQYVEFMLKMIIKSNMLTL